MITKLFVPISNNYDFIEEICVHAFKHGFYEEDNLRHMFYISRQNRLNELENMYKDQPYLTLSIDKEFVFPKRTVWSWSFKKDSFRSFEKKTDDIGEIKKWIEKNGKLIDVSLSKL